jgi:hypothetical protein
MKSLHVSDRQPAICLPVTLFALTTRQIKKRTEMKYVCGWNISGENIAFPHSDKQEGARGTRGSAFYLLINLQLSR